MDNLFVTTAINAQGPGREETVMGTTYRVVPATIVRNQVLVNNLGPVLLPAEAITDEFAEAANGAPIVTDHPTQSGKPVSARQPGVLNSLGVGFQFNARAEDGALKADVYLDVSRAEDVPDLAVILEKLADGETVELSSGFPAMGERKPGVFNGEEYEIVIYPDGYDHTAVFAEKEGACSVEDGCGLAANQRSSARSAGDIEFSGTETTSWADVDKTLEAYVGAYGTEDEQDASVEDLSADTKSAIASRTILGESDAETAAELISVPVVNPSTDNLNEGALNAAAAAAGGARGADLPDSEGIQATVDSLKEEHFMDESDAGDVENMATRLGRQMVRFAKRVLHQETSLDDIREMLRDEIEEAFGGPNVFTHVVEMFEDDFVYEVDPQGGEAVLWRAPYEMVEGEVEVGERTQVEKVTEFVEVENGRIEARHEYLAHHPTAGEEEMDTEQMIEQLLDNERVEFTREQLEDMDPDMLANVATIAGGSAENEDEDCGCGDAANEDTEETADASADSEVAEALNGIRETVETFGDRLERLEAETEPAREQVEQERTRLVGDIVENSDFSEEDLDGRPLPELRSLHQMATRNTVSYAGLGGPRKSDPSPKSVDLGFEVGSTLTPKNQREN